MSGDGLRPAETCPTCGRPKFDGMDRCPEISDGDPDACYRLGYAREKARGDLAERRYADRTEQWEAEVRRRVDAEDAFRALVERLDVVHASDEYRSVWTADQIRFGPYRGPDYTEALATARAALKTPEGERSTGSPERAAPVECECVCGHPTGRHNITSHACWECRCLRFEHGTGACAFAGLVPAGHKGESDADR